jgi:hypothetical protein
MEMPPSETSELQKHKPYSNRLVWTPVNTPQDGGQHESVVCLTHADFFSFTSTSRLFFHQKSRLQEALAQGETTKRAGKNSSILCTKGPGHRVPPAVQNVGPLLLFLCSVELSS